MADADQVQYSAIEERFTATGKHSGYQVQMWHKGLNIHCVLRDRDKDVLRNKMRALERQWMEKWTVKSEKLHAEAEKIANHDEAKKLTEEAETQLHAAETILAATLNVNDAVDWEGLKDKRPFHFKHQENYPGIQFDASGMPQRIRDFGVRPPAPQRTDSRFNPQLTLLDQLFPGRKRKKLQEASHRFTEEMANWQRDEREREQERRALESRLQAAKEAYKQEEQTFLARQQEANAKIDRLRENYQQGNPDAILANCELALNASDYPSFINKDFVINYNPENRILVVDYQLPPPSVVPTVAKVTYVKSSGTMKESHLTEAQHRKLYDSILYQMALRTIHELYEADTIDAIASIVFNGWVEDINPATGITENACIMSVEADKPTFLAINLANVDPKACFKKLKGVSAATLSGLAPVKPLLQLSTDDDRFIANYEVADGLDNSTNLAAMHWQDFEHLIREVFEKEFAAADGAEVKITQASADGGVDAIAFDPDPIRGGKIVIQAKRYTNTVGVSAVRDLYGTVLNEGANKGILVTTSDYGPDAYSFVKDKPLALLNGANLLHLLSKHGHEARIDIKAAKAAAVKYPQA